jgi:hypothetical protein
MFSSQLERTPAQPPGLSFVLGKPMRGKERTCPSTKVDKIMVGSVPSADWKTLAATGQKQGTSRGFEHFPQGFPQKAFSKIGTKSEKRFP